jgi:ankyrin repeat protein
MIFLIFDKHHDSIKKTINRIFKKPNNDTTQLKNLLDFYNTLPDNNIDFGKTVFNKLVLFTTDLQEVFNRACETNNLTLLKFVCNNYSHKINIHQNNEKAFHQACYNGHLKLVKYIWSLSIVMNQKIDIHKPCCDEFQYFDDEFREYYNEFRDNDDDNSIYYTEYAFRIACYNGHLNVVRYLISLNQNIDIHVNNEIVFLQTCFYGRLEVVKYLLQLSREQGQIIDIRVYNNFALRLSYQRNYLKVTKYVWQFFIEYNNEIYILENNEILLNLAFKTNYINAAKYILQLSHKHGRLIQINNDMFHDACYAGHLEVAKLIWSLNNSIDINMLKLFLSVSDMSEHLEVIQYILHCMKEISIHLNHDEIFQWVCKNKKSIVVKYVLSLDKEQYISMKNVCRAFVEGHLRIAIYILSINIYKYLQILFYRCSRIFDKIHKIK